MEHNIFCYGDINYSSGGGEIMEHLFKQICPNCKSSDLEYDTIMPEGEYMKQKIDCTKCGLEFTIWCETVWTYDDDWAQVKLGDKE